MPPPRWCVFGCGLRRCVCAIMKWSRDGDAFGLVVEDPLAFGISLKLTRHLFTAWRKQQARFLQGFVSATFRPLNSCPATATAFPVTRSRLTNRTTVRGVSWASLPAQDYRTHTLKHLERNLGKYATSPPAFCCLISKNYQNDIVAPYRLKRPWAGSVDP